MPPGDHRKPLPVYLVEDHNAARWLRVEYHTGQFGGGKYGHYGFPRGWYVFRVCPCHFMDPVTEPYETEARAERAAVLLVETSVRLGLL